VLFPERSSKARRFTDSIILFGTVLPQTPLIWAQVLFANNMSSLSLK